MKTIFHYIKYLLLCLFGTFVILSCGGKSQKIEEKNKADESYRNALTKNLSDVATANEIAEQELKRAEEKAAQERIEQERQQIALQLNGTWAREEIDPTFYEIVLEKLEFRGDQYRFRSESESRAFGTDWQTYTREGNKIYVNGNELMTIDPNGNIVYSDNTFERIY